MSSVEIAFSATKIFAIVLIVVGIILSLIGIFISQCTEKESKWTIPAASIGVMLFVLGIMIANKFS